MRLGETVARRCALLVAEAQAAGRSPSVVAAVLRDREVAWSMAVGDAVTAAALGADAPVDVPATVDTQYRIGSITKTVTAMIVLGLRDAGRLQLTDPLGRHVRNVPLANARIGDLLAHAAGAAREPDGPWWERSPGVSFAELARRITEAEVLPARRRFHYSNLAYGLLGRLIETAGGMTWYSAVRDHVLDPLGMADTTHDPRAPHAAGYDVHPFADVVHREPAHDTGAMAPAGQLWSTVGDLAAFGAELARPSGAVLRPATVEEMCAPQVLEDRAGWPRAYGYGVSLYNREGRTLVGHSGSMPGFLSALLVDRHTGVGAAVLANCYQGPEPVGLAARLVECVLEHEPPLPEPWRPAAALPKDVEALLGHWYWGSSPHVVSARAGDPAAVFLARTGSPVPSRFAPIGDDRWRGADGEHAGELLEARRDPSGAVVELVLSTYRMRRAPYGDPPQ